MTFGDRLADDILAELRRRPGGLTRNELRDLFQRHKRVVSGPRPKLVDVAANVRRNGPDDAKLIEALAGGATYTRAACTAGCSERTARRRMAEEHFRAHVHQARSAILERTVGLLAEGAADAAIALRELLGSDSDSIRLGAARALLDSHLRAVATADLDRRLSALEYPDTMTNGGPPL